MHRCGQNALETGITMVVADCEALQVLEVAQLIRDRSG